MRIVLVSVLKKNRKKKRKHNEESDEEHVFAFVGSCARRPQTTEIKKMTTKITTKKKTKKKTARKQQLRIKNSTGRFLANPLN